MLPSAWCAASASAIAIVGMLIGAASLSAAKPELQIETIKEESCRPDDKVKKGDTVFIHHNGFVDDEGGRRRMDSNCPDRDAPECEALSFVVGGKRIIKGLERGVVGMCVGETRELRIPPHLGYDDPQRPIPADKRPVPEGSWVTYQVELVRREREGAAQTSGGFLGLDFGLDKPSLEPWQMAAAGGGLVVLVLMCLFLARKGSAGQRRPVAKPKKKKGK